MLWCMSISIYLSLPDAIHSIIFKTVTLGSMWESSPSIIMLRRLMISARSSHARCPNNAEFTSVYFNNFVKLLSARIMVSMLSRTYNRFFKGSTKHVNASNWSPSSLLLNILRKQNANVFTVYVFKFVSGFDIRNERCSKNWFSIKMSLTCFDSHTRFPISQYTFS